MFPGGGLSVASSSSASLESTNDIGQSSGNNNSGAINFAPNSSAQMNKTITIAVIAVATLGVAYMFVNRKK